MMRHRERGQVLPIWIMGIIGTFALIVTALNYGNSLRYEIRAQSAADSASQAVLALQSQRWNEMMELLYGLNVEEYRIRNLLNGILLASTFSGGCIQSNTAQQPDYAADCETVYKALQPQYLKAVQRYSREALLLHKVAYNAQYSFWLNDATSLMNHISNATYCNNVGVTPYKNDGGDCQFTYNFVVSKPITRTGLSTVYETSNRIAIPSYGSGTPYGNDTEDTNLFAPVQVDIVTCALVPPLVPGFTFLSPRSYYAIGRAAATNVLFVQDWFEPGALQNPARSTLANERIDFQPQENYGTPGRPQGQNVDFYAVDFGGNAASDSTQGGFFYNNPNHNEMSVRLGWWNSIPVHPTNSTGAPIISKDCPTAGNGG